MNEETPVNKDDAARAHKELEAKLSQLPRINIGALLMPAVWGPAHGQWVSIFFYPLWLLADTCFTNAVVYANPLAIILAVVVFLGTAAITVVYASTAGRLAYIRVAGKVPVEKFLAKERVWVVVSALIALLFIGFATWYNLIIRIPAGLVT